MFLKSSGKSWRGAGAQQDVLAKVQREGDSAETWLPPGSFLSLSRASVSPDQLSGWGGGRWPPRHAALPPPLHTGFTFYSFLSSLPFDGLLCVQAVGKFSEMMSSSTGDSPNANAPHPHTSCCPPANTPLFHILRRDRDLDSDSWRKCAEKSPRINGKPEEHWEFWRIKHICEVRVNAFMFL